MLKQSPKQKQASNNPKSNQTNNENQHITKNVKVCMENSDHNGKNRKHLQSKEKQQDISTVFQKKISEHFVQWFDHSERIERNNYLSWYCIIKYRVKKVNFYTISFYHFDSRTQYPLISSRP
jgi:hypothetical protein